MNQEGLKGSRILKQSDFKILICSMDSSSYIPACYEMDSKDALDLSDSVSDFQFLAVSGLNWKNQIA